MESGQLVEKHSLVLRICHWINVVLLSLLIWSGLLIYWANQSVIKLPQFLITTFHLNQRLAEGMGWHFFIMWPFFINGLIYFIYLLYSGEWKRAQYPIPQKIAYTGVFLMALGSLITGLAIYKPVQVGWLTGLLGGYQSSRVLHFLLMVGFVFFIIVHVVQVARAGWNNFRSMVAGYEIEKK